ncbi:MAG: PAS domain S-box protein, partial [Propionibacteriales bacterium]|nr:PAS domain S-box protein [Propionibacteriales bacterium]
MKATEPAVTDGDAGQRTAPGTRTLLWVAAGGIVLVAVVGVYLGKHAGTASALTVSDFTNLLAAVVAAASCGWAAHRASDEKRAWVMLTLAATVYAFGQAAWTTYGITRNHAYPFPSVADFGYIGYALPATAALLLFPRSSQRLSSTLRTLLDALVIALAILFISWGTVLKTVYEAGGETVLKRVVSLGYPVADVLVLSLVLTLGMRRPAGQRMPWLLLGGGLAVLAVTDSTYVFLVYAGHLAVTGTPLALGWIGAWLLIGLAPWVPRSSSDAPVRRNVSLAIELIPYVPVLFAIVVTAQAALSRDRLLSIAGAILLFAVAARQVMIVYENVTLTRDLEAQVAVRTKELAGLGAIVQSSVDAIVGKTVGGVITSWNPGAERLYGWSAEEVLGRHVNVLVPAGLREEEALILACVRRGEQIQRYETERLRKDGSIVPVALTVSPIFDGGAVRAISAIGQDITDLKAKDAALAAARNEALESSRLKSEFLATMSHEIRTPMNGVIGLTSLLLETSLDETQRQYAEGVQGAGEALLAVINDILDFSKLEAGKVELEVADFDPRRLVEEVASLLAQTAHDKDLELIAYCRPEVPALLVGDGGRIRQVLLNLASNAVKFTATGEVAITVRATPDDDGDMLVRFEVADTGIGISAEARTRLFESFTQADASTTRRYGGTGLGLAISRKLTEAMGGDIGVDSEVGTGSRFWFQLPLPVAVSTQPAGEPLTHDLLSGLLVLVVDDNATNRLILQSQLTAWGMRPHAVEHPQSVVALMRDAAAAGHPYAVAVLDMCMPDMDGLDLARLISTDPTLTGT